MMWAAVINHKLIGYFRAADGLKFETTVSFQRMLSAAQKVICSIQTDHDIYARQ